MGKPRMIILIRHAQSEGNKNREIHQMIPDHRVKLTEEGRAQAEEAGRRLRALLRPDDTLQFYTSPYRRTRETTEGILRTLTSSDSDSPSAAPSPFNRHALKVYEEPRIREQDFGNFQPCSAEMERMWQERADYGHFFYRIPNGESAADAYDRISGFNESLWRSFGEEEFPSVCVLVTHGLMTRVFLMKWYHWSVEYFEDLRNVNHTEFVIMEKSPESGKYRLQSQLRTWSELKRQKAEEAAKNKAEKHQGLPIPDPQRRNTLSQFLPHKARVSASPPPQKWGGCVAGCDHHHDQYPRRNQRKTAQDQSIPPASTTDQLLPPQSERPDHPSPKPDASLDAAPTDGSTDPVFPKSQSSASSPHSTRFGRDGGGTDSGAPTPAEGHSDESDYFDPLHRLPANLSKTSLSGAGGGPKGSSLAKALLQQQQKGEPSGSVAGRAQGGVGGKKRPSRKPTEEDLERWANESGMGLGVKADALGDEPEEDQEDGTEGVLEEAEREDKSLRGSVY